MNGIHDMGGMHGMGPIQYEKDEPVFHERWESRVYALTVGLRSGGDFNLDLARHALEQLPPAEYLRMSYYEKWLARLEQFVVNRNVASFPRQDKPGLTADMVPVMLAKGATARRDAAVKAGFSSGQPVRTRNINPTGHTRLPRYARGKLGTIVRDHGVFVFPDTRAHLQGDKPQHVYSIRFDARELWGSNANARDGVYLDLWEDYLEPA
jgi:nitrile hydratase beta subunit